MVGWFLSVSLDKTMIIRAPDAWDRSCDGRARPFFTDARTDLKLRRAAGDAGGADSRLVPRSARWVHRSEAHMCPQGFDEI
jgi:hypothetical protein